VQGKHFEKSGEFGPAMQDLDVKMANEDWKRADDVRWSPMTYEALQRFTVRLVVLTGGQKWFVQELTTRRRFGSLAIGQRPLKI